MDFDVSKNYYDILWVDEKASPEEIKKAFKKAAVKHHPDKWGDKKKFQEMNEAYQVIGDEKKKAQYDAYRSGGYTWGGQGFGGGDFGGFGWGQGGFDFGDFDIGDIMWGIFGWGFGWGRGKTKTGWDDITVGINITFEEAFLGTKKRFAYERMHKIAGATEKTCETCGGRGSVNQQVSTPFGVMQSQAACRNCGWVGKVYTKDGKTLAAGGLEKHREEIEVSIPAWIKEWAYIKYSGKWNDGMGDGRAGDLYVQIGVASSKLYERKWDHIYVKAPVTIYDIVLWGEVTVDHPEGKLKVKIPKWTQIGDMIKISGKWFGEWWVFNRKWDLYVIPKIDIPKKLSKEQEKLWNELRGKK